jgi:hypothetical protein
MAVGRRQVRNQCSGDDDFDFDDAGTLTRMRIETHTAPGRPATRERRRPRPDSHGQRPTAEYPEGLLERLRIRVALTR